MCLEKIMGNSKLLPQAAEEKEREEEEEVMRDVRRRRRRRRREDSTGFKHGSTQYVKTSTASTEFL